MTEGRAILILSLFLGAIVAGVVVQRAGEATTIKPNPYPSLELIAEPPAGADLAKAIAESDSRALARLLDTDKLRKLQKALLSPIEEPFVEVQNVRFLGATQRGGRVVAAYVLSGRDVSGLNLIIGFVLDIENGQIVGVND